MNYCKRLILFTSLLIICQSQFSQVQWPEIKQESKPWTRWWWLGSAVNKEDLAYSMNEYAKAGLGGLEIVPIYGVQGRENEFIDYLTPKWMEMLDFTIQTAQKNNLGIDMANGTGWPFGGPWIQDEHAAKTIYHKVYELNGNETLKEKIQYKTDGYIRTANGKNLEIKQLKQPVTANSNLQALAIDQVRFPSILKATYIVAFGDNGQSIDITSKLDSEDNLNWTAPSGKWKIYAIFQTLHGKMVERAAPGGEGYALDHFSAAAIKTYFDKFDKAFQGHNIKGIRALFNDSYEVDDAWGESNWTPEFFAEFQKHRGYNLKEYLPALFNESSADINSRVIYDYRQTINELLLENYTLAWHTWAQTKGVIIRNQAHGSPANILDLYTIADIPETEGNESLHFKFASSAANLSGKKLVSAESATWLDEHFLTTLSGVKKAIDKYFLGGVNHIFYHGVAYSPKSDPWPGWLFYASVHFQPTNPFWIHFSALNNYVAQCQSFLQNSKPDNDILYYYPISDRYSDPGKYMLRHFHGIDKEFQGSNFEKTAEEMYEKGYAFDFVSDKQLLQTTFKENNISVNGSNYQTIVIPQCTYMPYQSWNQILSLVNDGATAIFCNEIPKKVPGLDGLKYEKTLDSIFRNIPLTAGLDGISVGKYGKGQILVGSDADKMLVTAKIHREELTDQKISFIRKKNGDKTLYFLVNNNSQKFEGWLPLHCQSSSVILFNAATKNYGTTKCKTDNNTTSVYLKLEPGESIFAEVYNQKISAPEYPFFHLNGKPEEIKGNWKLSFLNGGPVLPKPVVMPQLKSITELDNKDIQYFSGTISYKIKFVKPSSDSRYYLLDLGEVKESASVWINGKLITTLIGDKYSTVIESSILKESNELEIIVANTMANRIIYLEQTGANWKKFYNINFPYRLPENKGADGLFTAKNWKLLPSGLLGPVTLTALNND